MSEQVQGTWVVAAGVAEKRVATALALSPLVGVAAVAVLQVDVSTVVVGAAIHTPSLLQVVVVYAHSVGRGAGCAVVVVVLRRLRAVLIADAIRVRVGVVVIAADESVVVVRADSGPVGGHVGDDGAAV